MRSEAVVFVLGLVFKKNGSYSRAVNGPIWGCFVLLGLSPRVC